MKIVFDEREHSLYQKYTEQHPSDSVSKCVLALGDIVFMSDDISLIIIERKSLSDLLASIKDGRYEEQSHRLLYSSGIHSHHIIYLIEGIMTTLSPSEKKLVYSCITSLNAFKGFSVYRTASLQETSDWIFHFSDKLHRDMEKGKGLAFSKPTETAPEYASVVKKTKKDNITAENIGELFLSQIPGISHVSAKAILTKFGTFIKLIDDIRSQPDCLDDIYCVDEKTNKKRKLSKLCKENLMKYIFTPLVEN